MKTTHKHLLAALLGAALGVGGTLAVQKTAAPPASLAARIQALPPGSTFDLPAGTLPGELVLHNPQRLTLRGGTFSGGSDYCVKLDGGRDIALSGVTFTLSSGYGLMAVHVDGLTIDHCHANTNGKSGILTGDCRRVTITHSEATGNIREHGIYLSQHGDTYDVEGNSLVGNGRCACQVNAHGPTKGGATNVRIIGNDCRNCPTAGVQLAAVHSAVVAGNLVAGNRSGTVVWDDGSGSAWASSDIDLTGQSGTFNVAKNSQRVRLPK